MEESTSFSNLIVSYLRTGVPILWGVIVTSLLRLIAGVIDPALFNHVSSFLNDPMTISFITGLVTILWYAVWRKLEKVLPDSVTRLVLGSSAAPSYAKHEER